MAATKKELKCLFYQLSSSAHVTHIINGYFKNLAHHEVINTETVDSFYYYITHNIVMRDSYVLFNIAKVDTQEIVQLDDVETQQRVIVDKDETQGLGVDAQFLYDFSSGILLQKTGKGITNIENLRHFISKKLNISVDDIKFSLILDKEGLDKLDKMDQVHDFIFNVAIPEQLNLFADDVKELESGIELAKKLSGKSVEVRIRGERLDKRGLMDSVRLLQNYREHQGMKINSLNIYGDSEIIDLVKHKLMYYKKVFVEEITIDIVYNFLEEAYANKWEYLVHYENES